MRKVRELVAAVTRDDAALHNLRFDPAVLARTVGLDARQLSALHSAERFFATEKPITSAPPITCRFSRLWLTFFFSR